MNVALPLLHFFPLDYGWDIGARPINVRFTPKSKTLARSIGMSVLYSSAAGVFAGSAFPQAVVRVLRQRREQIADNAARAGLDFDGDGHAW